jgi:hypothetical protein
MLSAIAVSTAWGLLAQGPEPSRTPYPLPAKVQVSASEWAEQAERAFGLTAGVVDQAMTEEEWLAHQRKMSAMRPEERSRYQKVVREQITQRLKQKEA